MRLIVLGVAGIFLSACSVGMAARTGGVKTEDVAECQSRDCFLSKDKVEVLETVELANGNVRETYKFQLKRGSAGRAAMHGLLDVATLGIWEVVGTPIEATKKKNYIVVSADYDGAGRLLNKSLGATSTTWDPSLSSKVNGDVSVKFVPAVYAGKIIGARMGDGSIKTFEDDQEFEVPEGVSAEEYMQPAVINGNYAGVMLSNGEIFLFKDTSS